MCCYPTAVVLHRITAQHSLWRLCWTFSQPKNFKKMFQFNLWLLALPLYVLLVIIFAKLDLLHPFSYLSTFPICHYYKLGKRTFDCPHLAIFFAVSHPSSYPITRHDHHFKVYCEHKGWCESVENDMLQRIALSSNLERRLRCVNGRF